MPPNSAMVLPLRYKACEATAHWRFNSRLRTGHVVSRLQHVGQIIGRKPKILYLQFDAALRCWKSALSLIGVQDDGVKYTVLLDRSKCYVGMSAVSSSSYNHNAVYGRQIYVYRSHSC